MLLLTGLMTAMNAQTVDSIRIEQAGDFVKVYYKILASETDQTYRISIMASINGGLRSELRSVSGDIGENIVGGKDEYWIIWDVLKDVEELNSVEFFVKAELTKDLSPGTRTRTTTTPSEPKGWDKKRFSIMPVVSLPGPRLGLMIGYNGSFGVAASVAYGKIVEDGRIDIAVPVGGSIEFGGGKDGLQFGMNLTKRLVSYDSFQLHLAAGFSAAEMVYIYTDNIDLDYETVVTQGLGAGILLSSGKLSAALMYQHYDPGSVEKQDEDLFLVSGMTLFTIGIGVRF